MSPVFRSLFMATIENHFEFLNAKGYRETGHYLDQLVFGGTTFTKPSNDIYDEESLSLPPPMGIAITQWNLDAEPVLSQREAVKETNHTSSAWASKLLGEHFWQDSRYPEKSHNSFHRSFVAPKSTELIELDSLPHIYDEDRALATEWETKQLIWIDWRDTWDEKGEDMWLQTPWNDTEGRNQCFVFSKAFANQDIVTCALAAKKLVDKVKWDTGKNYRQQPPSQKEISGWLWHCIGLLMTASIPIIKQPHKQNGFVEERRSRHEPSREAKAAGHNDQVVARIYFGDTPATAGASEYYSIEGKKKKVDVSQMDHLERIDEFNKLLMKTGLQVPNNLYCAITQAARDIHADREGMPRTMGRSHVTNWSSKWYFEFPTYDSSLIQFSLGEMKWHPVAVT
ncbi:hypothetical protein F5Y08DRAFT_108252 [Xylaria arbuscula]|nr:hypothetical protein F5Y08DRAFT_108252 [Xylaria arbuscula]